MKKSEAVAATKSFLLGKLGMAPKPEAIEEALDAMTMYEWSPEDEPVPGALQVTPDGSIAAVDFGWRIADLYEPTGLTKHPGLAWNERVAHEITTRYNAHHGLVKQLESERLVREEADRRLAALLHENEVALREGEKLINRLWQGVAEGRSSAADAR